MSTQLTQIRRGAVGSRVIIVCALVFVASSMLKFLHPGAVLTYLASMGYEDADVYLIAVIEAATALLLLYPRTRRVGLLMASAYLGGAVAAHLAIHRFTTNDPFVAFMATHTHIGTLEPGVLLAALWFGTWLSERPARDVTTTQVPSSLRPASTQPSA
jgi:DoxX-like protein